VVVVLLGAAATLPAVLSGSDMATLDFIGGAARSVLLPFVTWMLVALLVHVVAEQKVVAHLVCIAGWVLSTLWFGAADVRRPASLPIPVLLLTALVSTAVAMWAWPRGGRRGRWRLEADEP
ncbi:MAG TPA: hypothetical protein VE861_13175, partial [Gemmatimonadaceae bacterium]|nr:hypothetical protein [Gemmatimonadaceae bacterium]